MKTTTSCNIGHNSNLFSRYSKVFFLLPFIYFTHFSSNTGDTFSFPHTHTLSLSLPFLYPPLGNYNH